jgi:hypothetical protein
MAYDFKKLSDKLKLRGIDLAEDAIKAFSEEFLDWLSEESVESETKVDDLIAVVVPMVKPRIMSVLDKIDGQEG